MLFPLPLQSISLHWSNKKVGTLPSIRLKSFHPFASPSPKASLLLLAALPSRKLFAGVLLPSRFPVHNCHNPEKHNSSSRDGGFSGHVAEPMILVPFSVFHVPYHEESLLKTLHSTTASVSARYCHSFVWVPGHRDTGPHVTPNSAQDLEGPHVGLQCYLHTSLYNLQMLFGAQRAPTPRVYSVQEERHSSTATQPSHLLTTTDISVLSRKHPSQ